MTWHEAGCSVIPIRADGTKRPAVEWKPYMSTPAYEATLRQWFAHGDLGIGVVCGAVSGQLEMLELEGRAATGEHISAVTQQCEQRGVGDVLFDLLENGYAEWTPSGGLHLLYRISDHDVPGNTKVARRLATQAELDTNPQDKIKVLAETRGEGGYVIVAPTGGSVHPTGDTWSVAAGRLGQIPTINWEQRCGLVEAVNAALDQMPIQEIVPARPAASTLLPPRGDRPGDQYNANADWEQILAPHGWRIHHRTLAETYWTRPGKPKVEGWSATTGYSQDGQDRLYVWSTSTVFQSETPYSKFAAYTLLEHNGDFAAATRALAAQGWGMAKDVSTYVVGTLPTAPGTLATVDGVSAAVAEPQVPRATQAASPAVAHPQPLNWRADWPAPRIPTDTFIYTEHTYRGMAKVYADVYHDQFRFCPAEKRWYWFNGRVWHPDNKLRHKNAVVHLLDVASQQAREQDDEPLRKWVQRMCRNAPPNLLAFADSSPEIVVAPEEFNKHRNLVSVRNGVVDLDDGVSFQPHHDPRHLLTREISVDYDKDATAPQFERFLQELVPDDAMRDYLQRAVGHTMLGQAGERALFLLHGPSGTGKSQFVRLMELLFGDFAQTATPQAFNASNKNSSITNDLNDLKSARFVSLSELDENDSLNESLVKRMTGGDTAVSRALYQENRAWRVEFTLWMATNHLPRLNSDDNAIWARVKPIAFTQVVRAHGEVIRNLADKIFAEEASGILNWALEGVRQYQERGLEDVDSITAAVDDYRHQVDTVAQFVDQSIDDHVLVAGAEHQMSARTLHSMYFEWCRRNNIRPLGERRFGQRMESLGYERRKTSAANMWFGVGTGLIRNGLAQLEYSPNYTYSNWNPS